MKISESSLQKVEITLNFTCTEYSGYSKMDIEATHIPGTSCFMFSFYPNGFYEGYFKYRVEMKVIKSGLFNIGNSDFYLIIDRCYFTSNNDKV